MSILVSIRVCVCVCVKREVFILRNWLVQLLVVGMSKIHRISLADWRSREKMIHDFESEGSLLAEFPLVGMSEFFLLYP